MGWKGTARSIGAAIRAAERDAQRRQRQAQRDYKEMMKHAELAQAADVVAAYEDYVDSLSSVHRYATLDLIDWEAIATDEPPPPPVRTSKHEDAALKRLTDYEPSLTDRMFKRAERRQHDLELALGEGRRRDDEAHRQAIKAWEDAVFASETERSLAESLLKGDAEAILRVVKRRGPFGEIGHLGTSLSFRVTKPDNAAESVDHVLVEADVHIHGDDIIPKQERRLLQSGKLSTRDMPKGRYYELHQDYVCGCVLRVANEALALLPIRGVIVNAMDEVLNPATGHIEEQPLVSIWAPRRTMAALNLPAVDPSDAMSNFLHRMSFLKTKGLAPVRALTLDDIPAVSQGGRIPAPSQPPKRLVPNSPETDTIEESEYDELLEAAARVIVRSQQGSISLLQRKLSVGYMRAAGIMDQLEKAGIVGPFEGSKARQVLLQEDELENFLPDAN